MKGLFTYFLVSQITGSPLLGLLAVLFLLYGGGSFYLGRLPDPLAPFRRWSRRNALRDTLHQNPHNVDARIELGGMIAERSPAEAIELLEEAARRCPELPLASYHLGIARLAKGDTAGGTTALEAALALKPDLRFGEPWVKLGDHHLKAGRAAQARTAYEKATEIHASHAEAWYKAGRAAAKAGDASGAKRHWEEALASTRHAPAFKRRLDRRWRIAAWLALRVG